MCIKIPTCVGIYTGIVTAGDRDGVQRGAPVAPDLEVQSVSVHPKNRCTACGDPLRGDVVHLKLDSRTGTYTDEYIPAEFFKGVYPFGRICASAARDRHRKTKRRLAQAAE